MATYSFNQYGNIEINFQGAFPSEETRNKMKSVKYRWDPDKRVWWAYKNEDTIAMAKEICGEKDNTNSIKPASILKANINTPTGSDEDDTEETYALKVKIKDIVEADTAQLESWEENLRDHVNSVMTKFNASHAGNAVGQSQESSWQNCFTFIQSTLRNLSDDKQDFELIFEYSMPGTFNERPDILLLTDEKVISLEFKKKSAPQIDDNKDDVAQAIRYKEYLSNHHKVTKDKKMQVISYLVCTMDGAASGCYRGIDVLNKDCFCDEIDKVLSGETPCSFTEDWLSSERTEMPDMLQAISIMYGKKKIPYISDVNQKCLSAVLQYIDEAKSQGKKTLILINGVPGAGKTAVGQSVVFEENKNGVANAVYLSGNGPLVEVLSYQIDRAVGKDHAGENDIRSMYSFKGSYFDNDAKNFINHNVPEQSILIFDEAQRAWDEEHLSAGFSEPEGLLRVGDKIFKERGGYAVIIGLYGNGQVIYKGEETGLPLWENALKKHGDWDVIASDAISGDLHGLGSHNIADNNMYLPISVRADFIDCSQWAELAIKNNVDPKETRAEYKKLQDLSMNIYITRDFNKIKSYKKDVLDENYPEWDYGILISNYAKNNIIQKALPGWTVGYTGKNELKSGKGEYGPWYAGGCKNLDKACSVFGCQGLELDCPIILFGGEYIRENGKWKVNVPKSSFTSALKDLDTIVLNNFRILFTRARKEMILLIPDDPILNETYQYFVDMGMDIL